MPDLRRLHPHLTATDLDTEPFIPELSPVVTPYGDSLMTRPWLDWARRLTLLVGVKTGSGGGTGTGDVVGPAGATPDDIAIYSGSTGKVIKDSLKSIASVISDAVNQAIAAILPGGKLPLTNLPLHHTTHEPGGSDAMAVDAAAAVGSLRTLGTGANQAAPGNDTRFAVPANHAPRHSAGGADPVTVTNLAGYPGGTTNFLRSDGTFATPTAGVPGAHHTTHEIGGTDVIANNAWTNQVNVFTQDQWITKSNPGLNLNDSSQASGSRVWSIKEIGTTTLEIQAANDAATGGTTSLRLYRDGSALVGQNLNVTASGGNVACKDQANTLTQRNTFTKDGFAAIDIVAPAVPLIQWTETGATVDARKWAIFANSQTLTVQATNDAETVAVSKPLIMSRDGSVVVGNNVSEKGRAVPMGHRNNVPFSASNFFGGGSMVWTVVVGNVNANYYTLIGKTLIWTVNIAASSLSGTPDTQIGIFLPGGVTTGAYHGANATGQLYDGASNRGLVLVQGTNYVVIQKDPSAAFTVNSGATYVIFTIIVDIN